MNAEPQIIVASKSKRIDLIFFRFIIITVNYFTIFCRKMQVGCECDESDVAFYS